MMGPLHIILPVHNRREITRRIVGCLQRQTYGGFHLLLMDDGSTDGTAEMVTQSLPSVTVIRGTGDWWWAGALHAGYRWLKEHGVPREAMVLILNDDAVFADDYLMTGVAALGGHRRTLIVSNAFAEKSGRQFDGGVHADWKHLTFRLESDPAKINCASTRGLFLHWGDFLDIGGFHPHLIPHYASDYEFTMRAHRKGYALLPDERLKLYSDEEATGIANFRSETSYRNFLRRLFSKKYMLQPVYYSNFVLLACPWPWKPVNWLIVWLSTCWKIVRYFFILVIRKNASGRGAADAKAL